MSRCAFGGRKIKGGQGGQHGTEGLVPDGSLVSTRRRQEVSHGLQNRKIVKEKFKQGEKIHQSPGEQSLHSAVSFLPLCFRPFLPLALLVGILKSSGFDISV